MAWENIASSMSEVSKVFVVRTIDDPLVQTFSTHTRDFIAVPVNEARREIDKLGDINAYIVTDCPEIAKQYGFKLVQDKYK